MEQYRTGEKGPGRGSNEWRASVPSYKRPEVKEKMKMIGGVPHYEGLDGKIFRQDLFDKMFLVIPGKIKKHGKDRVSGRTEVILDQF